MTMRRSFRPERWIGGLARRLPKYAYFPFGGGQPAPHRHHFAMMEAVLVLSTLARNWSFGVPLGEPEVKPKPAVTLRPGGPIRLVVHLRQATVRCAA